MGSDVGNVDQPAWNAPDPILRLPQLTWSISHALEDIAEFRGRWERLQQLEPERLDRLRHDAVIESVASSTRIEGAEVTDEEVAAILEGLSLDSFRSRDEQEVRGYSEALEIVIREAKTIPLTENYVKQLHSIVLGYSEKDTRHRGDYKSVDNHLTARGEGEPDRVVFRTASPFDTRRWMPALLSELDTALTDRSWHPLVLIADFVLWFLAIHPFQDGNGRLARVLTTLLLIRTGHDWVAFSSLERVVENNKADYYRALRASQLSARTDPTDFSEWLLFFLRAVRAQQLNLAARIERERGAIGVSGTQQRILATLAELQDASAPRIAAILNLPPRTVRHNLQALAGRKLVSFSGERKGRRYHTTPLGDPLTVSRLSPSDETAPSPEGTSGLLPEGGTRPEPVSVYMTPNARPYASIVIDGLSAAPQPLSDDVMDAFDEWVRVLRPDAEPWQSVPQAVRWHIPSTDGGGDLWQASLLPGAQIEVVWAPPVTPAPGGSSTSMVALWRYWSTTLGDLKDLLERVGLSRFYLRLALQTYPVGQPPVIDLDFEALPAAARAAPPSGTPPWSFAAENLEIGFPVLETLGLAAAALIRHFSYRHVEPTVKALKALSR